MTQLSPAREAPPVEAYSPVAALLAPVYGGRP